MWVSKTAEAILPASVASYLLAFGVPITLIFILLWLGWAPVARWNLRHIPGPWGPPFIGNLASVAARDMTFYFSDVFIKYGPVAKIWMGSTPWVLLSDPILIRKVAYKSIARPANVSDVQHVLVDEARLVDKEVSLWVRGPAWRASRKAFEASIMHPDRLAGHMPALRRCIDRFLSYLQPYAASGEAIDMKKAFGILSLAVVGEVAYGVDFWPEEHDDLPTKSADGATGGSLPQGGTKGDVAELAHACQETFTCMEMQNATGYLPLQLMLPALRPLWLWLAKHLPDAAQRRHMRARQKIADVSRSLMKQWQAAQHKDDGLSGLSGADNGSGNANGGFRELAGGISSSSFLAAMLGDRQQDDGRKKAAASETELPRMNDIQVIAQGLTFMAAGYDTTSTTLANITFLLAMNPVVQEKLRQELVTNVDCLADMDDLGKLPYLEAVVHEAMRLYPAASLIIRELSVDFDTGDGKIIPKGTSVCGSIYNLHMDPAQWPEPERFLPERFLPETKGLLGPTDPNAYIPFGMGPRMCVGYKLATMTVKATLAALILRYRVELHPRQPLPLRLKTGVTMGPVDGVWVSLSEVK